MPMSVADLGTKNDFAGEGQQQFTWLTDPRGKLMQDSQIGGESAVDGSTSRTPLVEEEAPFQNT
jgi:hypothetical protein